MISDNLRKLAIYLPGKAWITPEGEFIPVVDHESYLEYSLEESEKDPATWENYIGSSHIGITQRQIEKYRWVRFLQSHGRMYFTVHVLDPRSKAVIEKFLVKHHVPKDTSMTVDVDRGVDFSGSVEEFYDREQRFL